MTDDDHAEARADRGLTTTMRWVLGGAAVVVLAGIAVTIWLLVAVGPLGPQPDDSVIPAGGDEPTRSAGPSPGATPVAGSEVQRPDGGESDPEGGGSDRPPSPTPPAPLVAVPFPESASADGAYTDGFPAEVIGLPEGSDVLQTSIATEGDRMQATLVGRTDQTPEEVSAYFAEHWSGQGLQRATADGSAFSGPYEGLTVSVAEVGTGTRFTVLAVFGAG